MFTLPNVLTLLRLPLALLFLKQNIFTRLLSIILAMITDGLDGFIARRYRLSSPVGTLLDPLMDRFFVFFVIGILLQEESLTFWQAGAMLCRDFAILLFGLYLVCKGKLTSYRFRAIWWGKVTTFLQFIVFIILTLGYQIPSWSYGLFVIMGVMALFELYLSRNATPVSNNS